MDIKNICGIELAKSNEERSDPPYLYRVPEFKQDLTQSLPQLDKLGVRVTFYKRLGEINGVCRNHEANRMYN